MGESLVQALQLTAIGMGMTFASIGVLVLGMYLMTALIKDRKPVEKPAPAVASPVPTAVPAVPSARYKAAAAAVAVALAEQIEVESSRVLPSAPVASWSASVRAQHLAGRQRYDLRRARR